VRTSRNAQLIAPVASPWNNQLCHRKGQYLCNCVSCLLVIFAARELNHICRRGFSKSGLFSCCFSLGGFIEESHSDGDYILDVATGVCDPRVEETFCGFVNKIWFFLTSIDALKIRSTSNWVITYSYGRSSTEPEWQQSNSAVNLHPAGKGLTRISCISYLSVLVLVRNIVHHQ